MVMVMVMVMSMVISMVISMSKIWRVAIIGAGIGAEHFSAYLTLPDKFNVVAVCDINLKRAAELAAGYDDIKLTDNLDGLLADDSIDIIDICLPPKLHFDAVMSSLRSGKHVVCEKPLVASLHEANTLITQARKSDKQLVPVFQYRYGPASSQLQSLIKAELTGKPLVASMETHWNRTEVYYDNPWRGTWAGEQGGAVLGHAIHNHDFLCSVFGPVHKLSAFNTTRVNDIEVEDCAAIAFEMTNGALASSSITLGAATDTTRIRFCFDNITAQSSTTPYAPAEGVWTFEARKNISQQALDDFLVEVPNEPSGFSGLFDQLAQQLNTGVSNVITMEDGYRSLELVTAIYASARDGCSINLPLSKEHPMYAGWQPNE